MTTAAVYEQIGRRFVELAGEAEFAAPKKNTGAIKAKKCMTGLSCGGSCVSKMKICKRILSIEQQKRLKELKKRLKSGDLDAAKGIEELRQEQQGIKEEPKVDLKPKEPASRQKAMWVDTKSIKSSRPKSDFDEKDIEDLADSILESGGLYRPILLKQSGAGAYDVVDGHLAYHAAARAREKDLEKGSEVNGIILDDDYAEGSLAQVRKLAKAESPLEMPDGKKFD
jgi:ParB-like nuclease domain